MTRKLLFGKGGLPYSHSTVANAPPHLPLSTVSSFQDLDDELDADPEVVHIANDLTRSQSVDPRKLGPGFDSATINVETATSESTNGTGDL